MIQEAAYKILIDTVTNATRHQDYTRVTDLAKLYKMYITGNGIKDVLKQFSPRETDVMFEQRCNLTIAVTPASLSSVKKPFNKVPRTPPITRKIVEKEDKYKYAVEEIEDRIKNFYGGDNNVGGLDYYMQNRFVDLGWADPNSWIIVEFDAFDSVKEKARPRPYEVTASEAINFSIVNNIVKWLIIETDFTYKEKVDGDIVSKAGKKYTMYAEDFALTLEQTSATNEGRIITGTQGLAIEVIEKRGTFFFDTFLHRSPKAPCFRAGYVRDIETGGRTFVAPFHDGLCFLQKTIKQGSEFDLSTTLHLFPQKIIRETPNCIGDRGMSCDRGRLTDGTVCGTCQGTGEAIHTSGQDIIKVKIPETKEDHIELTDYIHYIEVPTELIKLQKEWVDDLKADLHQTMFNSTVLLRKSGGFTGGSTIDVTATEKDQDMDSVYDALSPFGEKVSSVWQTFVELIAIFTDNIGKVTIIHRLPSKFKLKSRIDLYNERAALMNSGAPAFALDSVDDELAQDIYADDTEGLLKYMIKKDHYPFVGKSIDEITLLLNSPNVLQITKVLYNYFDEIFTELEREYASQKKNFYLLPFQERSDLLYQKVDTIIEALTKENKPVFDFRTIPFNDPGANNNSGVARADGNPDAAGADANNNAA